VRIAILGSGSKGNCLVVDGGGAIVLIDVGFGPREIRRRLQHLGLDLNDVHALVITHAHGDHIKGAGQLAGSLSLPTFATEATKRFASTWTALKRHVPVVAGEAFDVGGLRFVPTKTCHDEPGSVCYAIDDGDEAFAICTDLGLVDEGVAAGLRGVDTLMLEFNHDRHMLQTGPYPAHLKRRVGSKYGHLNNDDAARLLGLAATPSLSRLLCAHLSEVNNTPDKALAAARAIVDGRDVEVAVAPQHAPTGWLRVRPRAGPKTPQRAVRPVTVDVATSAAAPVVGAHRAHGGADVVDASLSVTRPSPAGRAVAQETPPTQRLHLREAVRERQMRLFGAAALASPRSTATTNSTTDAHRKERP
jgi:phosphoribosyl 1,2-cyclic phosphodiesterase